VTSSIVIPRAFRAGVNEAGRRGGLLIVAIEAIDAIAPRRLSVSVSVSTPVPV
jgi:hypothetical protein